MKIELLLGLLLAGTAVLASAQTNLAPSLKPEFSLPPLQLRTEKEPDTPVPLATSIPDVGITNSTAWVASVSTTDADSPLGIYGRNFYVERVSRDDDSLFVRGLNNVFEPEGFHVGKTTVSCSLATAIKRKNPLCLLNPIFFNVSW